MERRKVVGGALLSAGGAIVMAWGPTAFPNYAQLATGTGALAIVFGASLFLPWERWINRGSSQGSNYTVLRALDYLGTQAEIAYRFADRDQWLKHIEIDLRDHLANERLVFWGRKLGDMWDRELEHIHPKLPIPAKFWRDGGDLNWFEILAAGPGPNQAWPRNRDKNAAYDDVSVLRDDLLRLYPRKRMRLGKPKFEPDLRRHTLGTSTLADEQGL